MAKKQIKITERRLKDGSIKFYASGRNITDKQKREYFKSQVNSSSFEPDRLNAEDRQLFGRIKGGVNAASRAYRLDNGQIVKRDIAKAAKKLGVDLEAGLKATGFKTMKELQEKKPEFFAAINEYLDSGKVANWYRVSSAKDVISDYRGKDVFMNGRKVSKSTARNAISTFNQELLHKLGSEAYQLIVRFNISGLDRLEFDLPDIDDIDDDSSIAELNEDYGDEQEGSIRVEGSPTPSKK